MGPLRFKQINQVSYGMVGNLALEKSLVDDMTACMVIYKYLATALVDQMCMNLGTIPRREQKCLRQG